VKLRLIAKTERVSSYSLRFVVPDGEPRYQVTPSGNDRSIEFVFKKDAVFGVSTIESAVSDNSAWFAGLVVGDDWDLKRALEPGVKP
jgi:hypothetical protein